jgi:ABC-type enterochelin transport system substrate-binding protein
LKGEKMLSTEQLLADGERVIACGFDVSRDLLPEAYQGKNKFRPLVNVIRQAEKQAAKRKANREVSVKWTDGKRTAILESTPERLAVLDAYAANVADDLEIEFIENEDRLYRNQMAFAAAMNLDLEEDE